MRRRASVFMAAGAIFIIASCVMLLSMPSFRRGLKQLYEDTGGVIGPTRSWTYYNDHVQNDGDPNNDWNFGENPIPAAEKAVEEGKAEDLLHALFDWDNDTKTLKGIFATTIDPRNGSSDADPGILASILNHVEEEKGVSLLPDAVKGVDREQRPDAAADYFEDHPESADESYEKFIDTLDGVHVSLEKRKNYVRQYYAYPGARHGRPGIVVRDKEKYSEEESLFLVLSWDDGTKIWIRVPCRFQPAGELSYWRPIPGDTPHNNPPSEPDKPDEPDEPNESKDMSEEMQSAHPGNSSVDGRNDESKDDKSDIPSGSAPSKTNPDTGRGENPDRPESKPDSGKSDKSDDDEASKGTESGSKRSDETDGQTESKGDFTGEVTATDGESRTDYGEEMDDNPPPVVPGANSGSGGSSSSSSSSSGGGGSSSSSSSSSGGGGSSNSSSSSSSSSSSDGGHNKLEVDEDFDLD